MTSSPSRPAGSRGHLRAVETPRRNRRVTLALYALGLAAGFLLVALTSAASAGGAAPYLALAIVSVVVAAVAAPRGRVRTAGRPQRSPRDAARPAVPSAALRRAA